MNENRENPAFQSGGGTDSPSLTHLEVQENDNNFLEIMLSPF